MQTQINAESITGTLSTLFP